MILELIRISGDKIKISLTKEDLKEYRITVEKMDYSEKQTKEIFRKLLSEAKNKTGFDAGKARVFIHIYQSSDGGCEIFVSKIATKKGIKSSETVRKRTGFYVFDSLDSVLKLCAQLKILGYRGYSSAMSEGNRYWLKLTVTGEYLDCYATEYGGKHVDYVAESYLREHCGIICKSRAVQTLGGLY